MASISKLMAAKDGRRYWRIQVYHGKGLAPYSQRFYWPEGYSKRAAERALEKAAAEFQRQCEAGEFLSREEKKQVEAAEKAKRDALKTVKQYAEGVFMPAKEQSISENTKLSYKNNLKHIVPAIGSLLMTEVTPAMLSKLLLDFRNNHAYGSAIKLYNVLNGIFQMATLDDTIAVNPMQKVKRPAPRKDEKEQDEANKAFTVEELINVINCSWQEYMDTLKRIKEEETKEDSNSDTIAYWKKMSLTAFRWYVFLNLAIDTGARRGELCALQWQDINWTSPGITIQRNVQYDSSKGVYITSPKNGKSRSVDIGNETLALLKQLRAKQAASCISKWVFTAEGSAEVMSPQAATRYFSRFGERHGLKNFHPHLLRHSSASVSITNGADVTSVSARLGHSDTAVTLRMYAHANKESIRAAGQAARDALKKKHEEQQKTENAGA